MKPLLPFVISRKAGFIHRSDIEEGEIPNTMSENLIESCDQSGPQRRCSAGSTHGHVISTHDHVVARCHVGLPGNIGHAPSSSPCFRSNSRIFLPLWLIENLANTASALNLAKWQRFIPNSFFEFIRLYFPMCTAARYDMRTRCREIHTGMPVFVRIVAMISRRKANSNSSQSSILKNFIESLEKIGAVDLLQQLPNYRRSQLPDGSCS